MKSVKSKSMEDECPAKEDVEGCINKLTDDILISIISRLTTREAAATSILSTRWRHLYAYVDRIAILPLELGQEGYQKMLSNYSDMINHTMASLKGAASIKEVKTHVPCYEALNDHSRLLEFALSKQVEKIDISMATSADLRSNPFYELLASHSLKDLSLSGVSVEDHYVEILLSESPLLERLSISDSSMLINVSIIGHSRHKLKLLDISKARKLESLKIVDAINLVSLRCYEMQGSSYVLKLSNVPKLIELGISDEEGVARILSEISHCVLDQIQTLKLWTSPPRTSTWAGT